MFSFLLDIFYANFGEHLSNVCFSMGDVPHRIKPYSFLTAEGAEKIKKAKDRKRHLIYLESLPHSMLFFTLLAVLFRCQKAVQFLGVRKLYFQNPTFAVRLAVDQFRLRFQFGVYGNHLAAGGGVKV